MAAFESWISDVGRDRTTCHKHCVRFFVSFVCEGQAQAQFNLKLVTTCTYFRLAQNDVSNDVGR